MGIFSTKLSTKTLAPLCRQLAASYGAGIPITRSLELVSQTSGNKQARFVLTSMEQAIRRGATLTQAMRAQDRYLPELFIELVSGGEVGGRLDIIFRDLAAYYEDRLTIQRLIVAKSAYPAFLLVAAWFLGTFSLMLVNRLGTRGFTLEGYLGHYVRFHVAALFVYGILFAGCVALSRYGILGLIWGAFSTYVWPISAVARRFATARFFRSLSLMIASGIPITQAIEKSAGATGNPYIAADLVKAIPKVMAGRTLVEAFAASHFLSPTAREMLLVGEQTGKLDEQLNKLAQYQTEEALHAVNIAMRAGEVLITLTVGAVVGYVVISFYSGYYGRLFNALGV